MELDVENLDYDSLVELVRNSYCVLDECDKKKVLNLLIDVAEKENESIVAFTENNELNKDAGLPKTYSIDLSNGAIIISSLNEKIVSKSPFYSTYYRKDLIGINDNVYIDGEYKEKYVDGTNYIERKIIKSEGYHILYKDYYKTSYGMVTPYEPIDRLPIPKSINQEINSFRTYGDLFKNDDALYNEYVTFKDVLDSRKNKVLKKQF